MLKNDIDKPTMSKPTPICSGKPTINTFICGTVLATKPSPTLIKNKIAIIGAAILTAVTNVALKRSNIISGVNVEKFIWNGFIKKKTFNNCPNNNMVCVEG